MKSHVHPTSMSGPAACDGAGMATMIGIVLVSLIVGCSDGSVTRQPRPVVGAPTAASCPGVDAAALSAVYVSTQGNDAGLCMPSFGTPCKTIARALFFAESFGHQALVLRHGLYQTTETIALKNTVVGLYGSCLFDGKPDRKYRTVIQANPAPGTPAISVDAVNATVSGLVVIGKDETASGASIAMTAGKASVTLGRTVLVAGKRRPRCHPSSSPIAGRGARLQ